MVLRPGTAASFEFHYPNACDTAVAGSRLRVTLPAGQGSLVVNLGGETRFGTCASIGARALQASTTSSTPPSTGSRIRRWRRTAWLLPGWAATERPQSKLTTSRAVTERLFSESPPSTRPAVLPCRLVDLGLYLCSYRLTPPNELNVWVTGGASVGYGINDVEFVD